jgi:hypothetical protein
MRTLKYKYLKVIQQNYGQGFEDVDQYRCNSVGTLKDFIQEEWASGKMRDTKQSLLAHALKEYRLMGYATRVIIRKEKINK